MVLDSVLLTLIFVSTSYSLTCYVSYFSKQECVPNNVSAPLCGLVTDNFGNNGTACVSQVLCDFYAQSVNDGLVSSFLCCDTDACNYPGVPPNEPVPGDVGGVIPPIPSPPPPPVAPSGNNQSDNTGVNATPTPTDTTPAIPPGDIVINGTAIDPKYLCTTQVSYPGFNGTESECLSQYNGTTCVFCVVAYEQYRIHQCVPRWGYTCQRIKDSIQVSQQNYCNGGFACDATVLSNSFLLSLYVAGVGLLFHSL
eukprot:TRINITY_DN11906_c0_g1_i2.p1 TRINITY_DN11906_c0_g1~~TRINITY_DN11906_c0_g1_i2.p1  ORF type:complete len:253 (-),score=40.24 TRINITY_DN11906_c0_g1_i2:67-825(-)